MGEEVLLIFLAGLYIHEGANKNLQSADWPGYIETDPHF